MSLAIDLRSYVRAPQRERGATLFATGKVTIIKGGIGMVSATVRGSEEYPVVLRREEDEVYGHCECEFFAADGLCKHIWAVLLASDLRSFLRGDTGRNARRLRADYGADTNDADDDEAPDDELSRAPLNQPSVSELSAPPARHGNSHWEDLIGQLALERQPPGDTWREDRELYYVLDLTNSQWEASVHLEVYYREPRKTGDWGKLKTSRIPRHAIASMPNPADAEILALLGGTPVSYDWSNRESIPSGYQVPGSMATTLLPKICGTGRCVVRSSRSDVLEQMTPVSWDSGPPWTFRLAVRRDGNDWVADGAFHRGEERIPKEDIRFLLPEGVLLHKQTFARFAGPGTFGWARLLRRAKEIRVPAEEGDQFALKLLNRRDSPAVDWPPELQFSEARHIPAPHIRIQQPPRGHRKDETPYGAYVSFGYDGQSVRANASNGSLYDPATRVLTRRDAEREREHIEFLHSLGFRPTRFDFEVDFQLAPKKLQPAVRALVGRGWQVEIEGKAFRKPTGFQANLTSGLDWFELRAEVDYGQAQATIPAILKALRQKSSLVELTDGSLGFLPEDIEQQFGALLRAGKVEGDHVRYARSQTTLLDALLATRPAIQADEVFQEARQRLRDFQGIEPAEQPVHFQGELRHYQREGLAWMQFLREMSFGGCLADDMGLGKTAQVLALLEQQREKREAEGGNPSLVVVPRSIVFNWRKEATHFAPKLRVLEHLGPERSRDGSTFGEYDLVLTTYGTLRRDIVALQNVPFDYAILDESQAIKNADSDSAKSVRLLNARHRLAMSGTPIENHVGELFSLFDFLNPGMLGPSGSLLPSGASARNPDADGREMLAHAVRPFFLRRTKEQVARELPPRIEQTLYCELDANERETYNELREHYRNSLLGRVEEQGIGKSQMHILEALLRLRQAACHPGLLDVSKKDEPSAKLENLLERLTEVLQEGHKALVFSQFTSLLAIVRSRLSEAGHTYEYLDGRTRDREARVERFQNDPECRLFLISLKAGGVGLNLTAADYVFLLDPWWNPAVEAQAIDRAHRIGQTQQVIAYRLIATDTVEEKVLELQTRKKELADSIIRADASLVSDLRREDLEFLLS